MLPFYLCGVMKATVIHLLFVTLLFCLPIGMYGKELPTKVVYLTLQADNGSFRQVIEMDGTITIYFKALDLINLNTILLNGSDVTSELVKNQYTLPVLTKNTTLDISIENSPTDSNQIRYNTVSL